VKPCSDDKSTLLVEYHLLPMGDHCERENSVNFKNIVTKNKHAQHITAYSGLYAQQGIMPNNVVKFHQIQCVGVAFMRILDGRQMDGHEQQLMPVTIFI